MAVNNRPAVRSYPNVAAMPASPDGSVNWSIADNAFALRAGGTWVLLPVITTPPAPSNTTPVANGGAGAAGVLTTYSRGDHQHPAVSVPSASSATPAANSGAGAAGAGVTYARGDHQHPGIVDASVEVGAAIARSKLAPGTVRQVLVNDGSGVMSGVSPGTAGNVLTSDGTSWASTAPAAGQWADVVSLGDANGAGQIGKFHVQQCTTGDRTFTLPASAAGNKGKRLGVEVIIASGTAFGATIVAAGADTIAFDSTLITGVLSGKSTRYFVFVVTDGGAGVWYVESWEVGP